MCSCRKRWACVRAPQTRSSLRVRVSVVNLAVAHELNFRHHGAEMMGMPRLENTRLRTRTPTLPKKHQSNSNRGSPNNPPPPNARQPGQHHRGGWCSDRHVVERAPGSEIRAQHLIHTDPRLARNAHDCQHNQDYYHSRLISPNYADKW